MPAPEPSQPAAANPTVLALLTADGVHHDTQGKCYVLGIFNQFAAAAFPAALPRSCLYFSLNDGYGTVPITLRLVGTDDGRPPVFEMVLPPVVFGSPLEVKEGAFNLPSITFPEPGVYCWQVVCRRDVLYERRIVVRRIE